MTEEPESEAALARVRTEYEDTVHVMAAGFVESLRQAQWGTSGVMSQTRVYTDLVEGKGAVVAFFLVDSLRYEMGVELREQLSDAEELALCAGGWPPFRPSRRSAWRHSCRGPPHHFR